MPIKNQGYGQTWVVAETTVMADRESIVALGCSWTDANKATRNVFCLGDAEKLLIMGTDF